MGARPVVLLCTVKEAMGVSLFKFHHLKPGAHTSAKIGDCKTKNVIEFVSKELPVRHSTCCEANIPDSQNKNHFYFHDTSQAVKQTMSVMQQNLFPIIVGEKQFQLIALSKSEIITI